jgi:hypothetical protein
MTLTPAKQPNVDLKNIEYLLLSIQSNPGRSQRWHLKRLHMYKHGVPDYHKGGWCCGYFTSSSYRNVLWFDRSTQVVFYQSCSPVDGRRMGKLGGMKSKSAQMHLTPAGWERANSIRNKIGLEAIPANHIQA